MRCIWVYIFGYDIVSSIAFNHLLYFLCSCDLYTSRLTFLFPGTDSVFFQINYRFGYCLSEAISSVDVDSLQFQVYISLFLNMLTC